MKLFRISILDGDPGVAYAPDGVGWSDVPDIGVVSSWSPMEFELRDGPPADFLGCNVAWRLCSAKMKEAIEGLCDASDALQWLPVVLKYAGDRLPYWILQFTQAFDVLDPARSIYDGEILIRPAYDYRRIGAHRVFCNPTGMSYEFIVVKAVQDALEALALTELNMTPLRFEARGADVRDLAPIARAPSARRRRASRVVSVVAAAVASATLAVACGGSTEGVERPDSPSDASASSADVSSPAIWDGAVPTNSVTGAVGATTPVAADALMVVSKANEGGFLGPNMDLPGVAVQMTSRPGLCGRLTLDADEVWLFLAVVQRYPTEPSLDAPAVVQVLDDATAATTTNMFFGLANLSHVPPNACEGVSDGHATGGTIAVFELTATSIAGSFDLLFPNGELTGTFNAPLCMSAFGEYGACYDAGM